MKAPVLAVSFVALAALLGSACASASAKAPVDRPAMNVPPAPPRVLEPPAELEPEPVGELPTPPASAAPSRPNRQRDTTNRAASEPKPKEAEAKPPEATTPPPQPETAAPPAPPPVQLRTPQTADSSGAAKAVQATIDRANAALGTVNYQPLNDERKKAYNDVKRFIQQASDAMKQGNYVFGQAVATKAETLARELAGK